jgi:hypothetical protein
MAHVRDGPYLLHCPGQSAAAPNRARLARLLADFVAVRAGATPRIEPFGAAIKGAELVPDLT